MTRQPQPVAPASPPEASQRLAAASAAPSLLGRPPPDGGTSGSPAARAPTTQQGAGGALPANESRPVTSRWRAFLMLRFGRLSSSTGPGNARSPAGANPAGLLCLQATTSVVTPL
jgi:hypothetical protein